MVLLQMRLKAQKLPPPFEGGKQASGVPKV